MVRAAILFAALVALCSGTRPVEPERFYSGAGPKDAMEPPATAATSFVEEDSSLNSTEEDGDELAGSKCCCYFPMTDEFKSNSVPGLDADHCPERGCNWGVDKKGRVKSSAMRVCSEDYIGKRDIYCKVTTGMFGCRESSGIKNQIPREWRSCYGYKADGVTVKDCMAAQLRG
mmetsp:Transcript_59457/g.110026  ORF Transcript_59457/g.110026 Transcript_59457/m.110026 type:complete len:173 (+) Transcript_59457:94-612(+)